MYSEESNFNKEINFLASLCSKQYFSFPRCKDEHTCGKQHVGRVYYPCIHYFLGNCKYSFNCKFSHVLVSRVPPTSEDAVCFFSLMDGCNNQTECKKKHVSNLKELSKFIKFDR